MLCLLKLKKYQIPLNMSHVPLTLSETDASAKTPPCPIPSMREVQLQQPLISHKPVCVPMQWACPCRGPVQGVVILKESITLLTLCQFTVPLSVSPWSSSSTFSMEKGLFQGLGFVGPDQTWVGVSKLIHIINAPVLEI